MSFYFEVAFGEQNAYIPEMKWQHVGKETYLLTILARYKLRNIFNTNEIAQFYKAFTLKTQYCISRLTALLEYAAKLA